MLDCSPGFCSNGDDHGGLHYSILVRKQQRHSMCAQYTYTIEYLSILSRLWYSKVSDHVRRCIHRPSHGQRTVTPPRPAHSPSPTHPHTYIIACCPSHSFQSIDLFDIIPLRLHKGFGSDLHSRRCFVSFLPFVIISINIHPNQHCPAIPHNTRESISPDGPQWG